MQNYDIYTHTAMMPPCMAQSQYMLSQEVMSPYHMPLQNTADAVSALPYTYLPQALHLIKEVVAGEREDRMFYEYLTSTAPSEEDKEIIKSIRDNEIQHFSMFRQIYYQLTGQQLPPPQDVPFDKPASYCDGIKKALMGEQKAVQKYRKILFALQNRVHINMT